MYLLLIGDMELHKEKLNNNKNYKEKLLNAYVLYLTCYHKCDNEKLKSSNYNIYLVASLSERSIKME